MLHNNTIVFSWEHEAFEFREKRKNWYWIVGFIAAIVIGVGILMENHLFSFIIFLGVFILMVNAHKEPDMVNVEISEDGIHAGNKLYRYGDIYAFWMKERPNGEVVLILMTNERITPLQSIPVHHDIDPLDVREYLLNFIEEEEMRESYTQRLLRIMGM